MSQSRSNDGAVREQPVVYIVDDDESVAEALSGLFRSIGLKSETFGSATEFLEYKRQNAPSCLVIDIRLPGIGGLDFQGLLKRTGIRIPLIFMSGYADIAMSVQAMKDGAVDFLAKPVRDQDMLDAVSTAIEMDARARKSEAYASYVREQYAQLSEREQAVMALVTSGLMNKQIAGELGLQEITVKIYRGRMMKKMEAKSLVDLFKKAEILGVRPALVGESPGTRIKRSS